MKYEYWNMMPGQDDIYNNGTYDMYQAPAQEYMYQMPAQEYMYQMPMQECMYPMNYHQSYGHLYSHMQPALVEDMACYMMYPNIYYRLYPYVSSACDKMDNPYVMYPPQELVEKMVDECYDKCLSEMPDLEEYAKCQSAEASGEDDVEAQKTRTPILRDLIAILLLTELFRKRRHFNPRGAYDYGDGYWR